MITYAVDDVDLFIEASAAETDVLLGALEVVDAEAESATNSIGHLAATEWLSSEPAFQHFYCMGHLSVQAVGAGADSVRLDG